MFSEILQFIQHCWKTWTIKARDAGRITAAEMKYMRRTAGYTWTDYKTNTQITKELKITPVLDKLLEYKRNWIQHVNRMPRNRLPRVMKHYSATGRRNHGRPLKRLLDMWDRNESTSGPTPWQIYDDDDDYEKQGTSKEARRHTKDATIQMHNHNIQLFLFDSKDGYANASRCYVIRTMRILLPPPSAMPISQIELVPVFC